MEILGAVSISLLDFVVRISLGISLFARALERSDHFARRVTAVAIALLIIVLAASLLLPAFFGPEIDQIPRALGDLAGGYYAAQFLIFSILLVAFVATTRWLFQTTIWTALFCCSAGYAIQNLASGIAELMWQLLIAAGFITVTPLVESRADGAYLGITWLVSICVYLLTYALLTSHLSQRGLEQVSGRSMLGMMVIVILMIIGFDLLIKSLTDNGMGMPYIVALRLVHGSICIFTVWMEYELLINRRLMEEQEITDRLAEEHERQYELSRQSMSAINARVHDIRHEVFRTLSTADIALDRKTASQLAHDVEVFDSAIHTGNEALSTVLTQKGLVCQKKGILLNCMADGRSLSFMLPADIYELFSCLFDEVLENAMTSESDASGLPSRPSITVVVCKTLGSVAIHMEATQLALQDVDESRASKDLFQQTVKSIVDRYGGTMTRSTEGSLSQVTILLPERAD